MSVPSLDKLEKKHLKKKEKKRLKKQKRKERKKLKRKKKNALVLCHSGKQYWTTQDQFWQWFRDKVIVKTGDSPLTGRFVRKNEEYAVMISNTVLNLACPNHLRGVLEAKRYKRA